MTINQLKEKFSALNAVCGEALGTLDALISRNSEGDVLNAQGLKRCRIVLADYYSRMASILETDVQELLPKKDKPLREYACPGVGGNGNPCCDRPGVYNGFGSDGPLSFTCPKHCSCHD